MPLKSIYLLPLTEPMGSISIWHPFWQVLFRWGEFYTQKKFKILVSILIMGFVMGLFQF